MPTKAITPCDNCPHKDVKPAIPSSRKNVVLKDNYDNTYFLRLTDEQIALLDYLDDEGIFSGSWEVAENSDWVEV